MVRVNIRLRSNVFCEEEKSLLHSERDCFLNFHTLEAANRFLLPLDGMASGRVCVAFAASWEKGEDYKRNCNCTS